VGGFRSGKKHRFREFLPAGSRPTMTARADPHGYSAKSASSPDGIRPALRKWKGDFSTFPLFHFARRGDLMSVFFNLLLFVGVFYLILQIPEPGDWRAARAPRAAGNHQPTRKVA